MVYLAHFYVCRECNDKGPTSYNIIITDEAQDQTPCQAAALWKHPTAVTYLVGDARQRIYRWRGARDDFEGQRVEHEFRLNQTWRFGSNIAAVVSAVMACQPGDQRVVGRSPDPGKVVWPSHEAPVRGSIDGPEVIVTRSNKGMFDELKQRIVDADGAVPTWTFLDDGIKGLLDPGAFRPYLKLHGGEGSHMHGEDFETWEELKEYAEDEGDAKISAMMAIVERWGEDLPGFLTRIEAAKASECRGATLALVTAHKSKGLEFPCVTIGQDFVYPVEEGSLMSSKRMRKPYWQEELNIVYVAMSRAQHQLRLSEQLANFLLLLGQEPRVPPAPPSLDTQGELDNLRLQDAVRWQLFEQQAVTALACEATPRFEVTVETVPWPRGPQDNLLGMHEDLSQNDMRSILQLAVLRFHPDKFFVKWRRLIPEEERSRGSRLHVRLAVTIRAVLQLRKDWFGQAPRIDEECGICMQTAARPENRWRTACCRQPICADCFQAD